MEWFLIKIPNDSMLPVRAYGVQYKKKILKFPLKREEMGHQPRTRLKRGHSWLIGCLKVSYFLKKIDTTSL